MTSQSPDRPQDSQTMLHAYFDGELDAADSLAFEQSMAKDAALAGRYRSLLALRQLMRDSLPRPAVPGLLRAQMIERYARPAGPASAWRTMAASLLIGAFLASGLTYALVAPRPQYRISEAILAAHQRSLLAAQPIDVASSDRHVVKPWLSAKLAASPAVVDLANQDFPLVGGRVDIVDSHAVATLVYRRREHLISLTAVPLATAAEAQAPEKAGSSGGYATLRWQDGDFAYYAVADLPPADLQHFVRAFRQAAGGTPEK
jgi:anti-sigma factor RsiW